MNEKPLSAVEKVKEESHGLRGDLAAQLAAGGDHFSDASAQLLKFHGTYQQEDRDQRRALRGTDGEPAHQFMVRCKVPGGVLTGEHTARDLAADHELVGRLAVRATQRTALVAIFLLVRPVELEELSARVREMVAAGSELGREITPQAVALLLHLLDRAERLLVHATTTSRRPSASTWPTSGRLNSGGGSVPLRSSSRTLLPESVTWDSASCGQVLGDAMPPQRWQ